MNEITNEYNVYIDESGDEGIRKGSKYFILTAIIVKKDEDLDIAKNVDIIKRNLEMNIKNQLHWNSLKGRPNKIMIMETISNLNIKIIPNERKRFLQLADCCCSALFQALKYNDTNHFEYVLIKQNNIYIKKNNLLSYGMKLVPSGSNSNELFNLINYIKK